MIALTVLEALFLSLLALALYELVLLEGVNGFALKFLFRLRLLNGPGRDALGLPPLDRRGA
jgi:hypothetical protein